MQRMNLLSIRSEIRLAFHEWRSLIGSSLSYEIQKRVVDSHLLGPAHSSLKVIDENVKRIAARGFAARVKLTRILVRMSSALLHNNSQAFEQGLLDLIELGKKVSQ